MLKTYGNEKVYVFTREWQPNKRYEPHTKKKRDTQTLEAILMIYSISSYNTDAHTCYVISYIMMSANFSTELGCKCICVPLLGFERYNEPPPLMDTIKSETHI